MSIDYAHALDALEKAVRHTGDIETERCEYYDKIIELQAERDEARAYAEKFRDSCQECCEWHAEPRDFTLPWEGK